MHVIWRTLYWIQTLNHSKNMSLNVADIATMYDLQTFGSSWFVLKVKADHPHLVLKTRHNDKTWKGKFFFVKRSSIPHGVDLPYEWVTKGRTVLLFIILFWRTLISFVFLQFRSLKNSYLHYLILKKEFKISCFYRKLTAHLDSNKSTLKEVLQILVCLPVNLLHIFLHFAIICLLRLFMIYQDQERHVQILGIICLILMTLFLELPWYLREWKLLFKFPRLLFLCQSNRQDLG